MDPQEIISRYKCVMVMYVMEQIIERSWLGDFKTYLSKVEKEKDNVDGNEFHKEKDSLVEKVMDGLEK